MNLKKASVTGDRAEFVAAAASRRWELRVVCKDFIPGLKKGYRSLQNGLQGAALGRPCILICPLGFVKSSQYFFKVDMFLLPLAAQFL